MSLTLSNRELSDLECLLDQSYYPLTGFMTSKDYESTVSNCRLSNGQLWSLPIVLHITEEQKESIQSEKEIILRDETFLPIASLAVEQIYKPDFIRECIEVYGTIDTNHPTVARILKQTGYYIGGSVKGINNVQHYDFMKYRLNPDQIKSEFINRGWKTIIGFQTRNPLHRSHVELTRLALKLAGDDAKLLLHPVVGDTQECDIDYFTRCQCYQKVLKYYPQDTIMLAL